MAPDISNLDPIMTHDTTTSVAAQLRQHSETFDIRDVYRVHQLIGILDTGTQTFMRDPKARLVVSF
jgi:hypothetical protein